MPGDFSSTVLLVSSIDFRNTKQKNSFKFILFHIFEITSKSSNRNTTTDSRARHSTYLPQPNEPNMRTVLQHFDGNCHKLNTYVPEVLCTYATDPAYDHLSPCSNVTVEHADPREHGRRPTALAQRIKRPRTETAAALDQHSGETSHPCVYSPLLARRRTSQVSGHDSVAVLFLLSL